MRYFLGNTQLSGAFQIEGVKFPANWLALAAPEDLERWGITTLEDLPPPETSLADLKVSLAAQIDMEVDSVYARAIGNRQFEYTQAEEQAQAYKDAGYTGTVPGFVASWVAASGLGAQAAADSILATAAAWRNAAGAMRAARLGHKAQAQLAASDAALSAVRASWSTTITQIRAALGLA
jgi:hypothetical protein